MLQPGDTLGEYRIEGLLGRGGMATVYRAHQRSLDRTVAIKVLPESLAEEEGFRERFRQEAIAIARLRHPAILVVFDYGEQDGTPYLVSEYVEGGTLADRLGAPLPLPEVMRWLAPIAAALDFAHERGIVHRDVKPSNILIARDGGALLADFGLAKLFESERRLTQTGMLLGTPQYMAPELAHGGAIGPSVDRYALAVIAYEMLTGSVPFDAPSPQALLLAHVQQAVPQPRALNPALSPSVESVLLRGLEKSPDARYPSATAFITALEEASRATAAAGAQPPSERTIPVSLAHSGAARQPVALWRRLSRRARVAAGVLTLAVAGLAAGVYEAQISHHSGGITPGTWSAAGYLDAPVFYAQAAGLPDGNALVLGGYGLGDAGRMTDEYDVAHGSWLTLAPMRTSRSEFSATTLADGRILVAGGDAGPAFTATAELFDPRRRLWQPTGSLHTTRRAHTAVRLQNGTVLLAGGEDEHYTPLHSAEIYDPARGTWSVAASTASIHLGDTAVLLPSGRVLLAGGGTDACEIYDPFSQQWRPAASMHHSRQGHTLTLLGDGRVLAAGGTDEADGSDQASAEIYDPASDTWTMTGSMHVPRSDFTATLLRDGTVLVTGGQDGKQVLASAERYDPATGRWTLVAAMHTPRARHVAVAIDGGTAVLIAGGLSNSDPYLATTEIYRTQGG
jgi:hypothetical protein